MLVLTLKRLKMYIHMNMMDHKLMIISPLGVKETRDRTELGEIMVKGETLSCAVRRVSGELGGCLGE